MTNRAPWLLKALHRVHAFKYLPKPIGTRLYNSLFTPREEKPLEPALRQRLIEEFRADVDGLAELLGRDLSAWNR